MIRKFKAFGLALVAVFAMSALVAQAASATFSFTAPEREAASTTFLTGTKTTNHIFKTPKGEVTCTTISFTGSAKGIAQSEQTIIPTYTGCTAFGFTAHVKMNGCDYLFTTPTVKLEEPKTKYTGEPPHIKCPAGASIELTPTTLGVSVCTSKIGEQTPTSGHVIYHNKGAGAAMDIDVEANIGGIHYIGTGGVCGENKTNVDATYTGGTTLRGYTNEAHTIQTAITVD